MELKTTLVHSQIRAGVARIQISNPERGNALTITMLKELRQLIEQVTQDNSCRVITLLAEGDEFCKGLDLEESFINEKYLDISLFKEFQDCLSLMLNCSLPIIACVDGNVSGGGVGLVTACDLVLATKNVSFMLPELIVGMIPALITPVLLRRLTLSRSKYLALSTRRISVEEAHLLGLVDEVAVDCLNTTLNRQLQRLFRSSPKAIATTKQYYERLHQQQWQQQTDLALQQLQTWLDQPEVVEDIRSFAMGLSPQWFQKYRG